MTFTIACDRYSQRRDRELAATGRQRFARQTADRDKQDCTLFRGTRPASLPA